MPPVTTRQGMRDIVRYAFAALALLSADVNPAQAYPDRPIRLVVPFPPGGGLDVMGRAVAAQVEQQTGRTIVVDNRAGANGIIGSEIVARARADGYTVMNNGAALVVGQIIYRKLPYDIERDFTPITSIGRGIGYLLLVNASSPVRTVKDLIALAKSKEGPISYGSAGVGNPNHLALALFSVRAGIDPTHVPHKGMAPSINALLTGDVQFTSSPASVALPQVKAGRLRALGFTGTSRWPVLPDVPTIAEAGVAGYSFGGGFVAWWAPAKTPAAIIGTLQKEVHKALQIPKVRDFIETGGYNPGGETSGEFEKFIRAEMDRYREAVTAAKIEMQ